MNHKFLQPLCVVFTMALLFFTSCEPVEDIPNAPQLPPTSSLVMDFNDNLFGTGKTEGTEGDNLNFAAASIGIWNTILTIQMAIPVAAFVHAFDYEADYADGTWTWAYDYNFGFVQHSARLEGRIVGDDAHWSMFISKNGEYTDFLWFTGISALDGTDGTWALNANPNAPTAFIAIDWANPGDGTQTIRYSNAIVGNPDNGSYIEYGVNSAADLDAHYHIYSSAQDNLLEIQWNRATLVGQLKAPWHFGDESWHCWNELLEDIECGG